MRTNVAITIKQALGFKKITIDFIEFIKKNRSVSNYEARTIFSITFLSDNKSIDKWYGLTFNICTNNLDDMKYMMKIAKTIHKDGDAREMEPDSLLRTIGAQKHYRFNNHCLPESFLGLFAYKVLNGTELYNYVYAANVKDAEDKFEILKAYERLNTLTLDLAVVKLLDKTEQQI